MIRRTAVLMAFAMLYSCEDTARDNQFTFEELEPIIPGVYTTSHEVHVDECVPDFWTVREALGDWPPPEVRVEVRDGSLHFIQVWYYSARTARSQNFTPDIQSDNTPFDEVLQSAQWPGQPEDGWAWTHCEHSFGVAPYVSQITARAPYSGRIEIDVEAIWGDRYDCDEVLNFDARFIPEHACRESYTVIYDLDEPCATYDGCRLSWNNVGPESEEFTYPVTPRDYYCDCDP